MAFALSAKFAVAGAAVKVAPASSTRRAAAATPTQAKVAKKYVNPEHVMDSRKKLRESYERKLSQAAGVKLIPMKQTMAQKLASMVVSTMGRKEYIPREILFTKPSLVFGSDTRPGSSVDIAITASGNVSAAHCKFDASGDNVTVCDLGSATGTFLDGTKLKDDECAVLAPGMAVSLDIDRGITYEVVKLTAEEMTTAAGPVPGAGEGWRSEASLEDRQADRIAWIAAWEKTEKKSTAAAAPASGASASGASPTGPIEGWMSEASLEDRQADRIAWIAAWEKTMGGSATGAGEGWRSEASLEDRQADRIAWIAAWEKTTK